MEKEKLGYPFVTRDMLAFEQGTAFTLRVSTQATVATTLTIRGLTREGVFTLRVTTTSDAVLNIENFRIPDIPISVVVVDSSTSNLQGRVFAVVNLVANGDILQELCAGYVYGPKGISYPAGSSQDMRPGGGFIDLKSSANPAAGSELTYSIPAGVSQRIKAIDLSMATDATVANRRIHIVFSMFSTRICEVFSDIDQTASTTRIYSVMSIGNIPDRLDDNDIIIPMPDNILLTGPATITTETTNFQAGDNISAANVLVEEWIEAL